MSRSADGRSVRSIAFDGSGSSEGVASMAAWKRWSAVLVVPALGPSPAACSNSNNPSSSTTMTKGVPGSVPSNVQNQGSVRKGCPDDQLRLVQRRVVSRGTVETISVTTPPTTSPVLLVH